MPKASIWAVGNNGQREGRGKASLLGSKKATQRELNSVSQRVVTEGTVGVWRPTEPSGEGWAGSGPSLTRKLIGFVGGLEGKARETGEARVMSRSLA